MLILENPNQLSISNPELDHQLRSNRTQNPQLTPTQVLSDAQLGKLCRLIYRRHTSQIRQRRTADRLAADHLAACGFIPADGSFTFKSPIVRFDEVVMLVVHWQRIKNIVGTRYACRLRAFGSWFNSQRAKTYWDGQRFSFAVDFSHPNCWKSLDRAFPAHGLSAARIAMDLESEIHRLAPRIDGIDAEPKLPGTLMAIPRSAQIVAEPTPTVVDHAIKTGLSWRAAWEHLNATFSVPDSLNPLASTCQLVDTRICSRARPGSGWPGKVALFHDLRGLLGRAVENPSDRLDCKQYLPAKTLLEQARAVMSPDISASCLNETLLESLSTPRLPLTLPGLTKIQTWLPAPLGPRADAFRIKTSVVDADLWSIR